MAIGFCVDYTVEVMHFSVLGAPGAPQSAKFEAAMVGCGYDVLHGCSTAFIGVFLMGLGGASYLRTFSGGSGGTRHRTHPRAGPLPSAPHPRPDETGFACHPMPRSSLHDHVLLWRHVRPLLHAMHLGTQRPAARQEELGDRRRSREHGCDGIEIIGGVNAAR
eukprot:6644184-Prymnesium_polylepis.1